VILEGCLVHPAVRVGWEETLVDGRIEQAATNAGEGLLDRLGELADPRDRRGVRHSFVSLLAIAVAAVGSGARSWTEIGEFARELTCEQLARLGRGRAPMPAGTSSLDVCGWRIRWRPSSRLSLASTTHDGPTGYHREATTQHVCQIAPTPAAPVGCAIPPPTTYPGSIMQPRLRVSPGGSRWLRRGVGREAHATRDAS